MIGGWVLKYLTVYLTGTGAGAADDGTFLILYRRYESAAFISCYFIILTSAVVLMGVQKGIEKVSTV